jgi:hypothetical protein
MGPVIVTVILVLVLVIIGLLFAPIDIYLDTSDNNYYAEIKGLMKASIEPDETQILRIKVKVPFRQFYFYPLKPRRKKTGKKQSEKKERKHWNRFAPKTIWRVLRSFEIKKWNLDLDTGDAITNAKLYPLFSLLNYRYGRFHINFEGKNHAMLLMRNRPIKIIKSVINF